MTKSIRLEEGELRDLERVGKLSRTGSESAFLKTLLLRGLHEQKLDLAVQLFTRNGLSTGEIAQMLDMSRLEILHTLADRHIPVMDGDPEDFRRSLEQPV